MAAITEQIDSMDIESYSDLLEEQGLPAETPKDLVLELIESLEEQGIDFDDAVAVEKALLDSALWAWIEGEDIDLSEELPFEAFAQRIAGLFGA